jgi:transglutaminase-like putative cysteine protease
MNPAASTPVPSDILYTLSVARLCGLGVWQGQFLSLDRFQGYLVQIDPKSGNVRILNSQHTDIFRDANNIAVSGDTLWLTKGTRVYQCDLHSWEIIPGAELPDRAEGIAVAGKTLYVSNARLGQIWVINATQGRTITQFRAPGVGVESLVVEGENLWVCDHGEQTVYCLDRATGQQRFNLLTPFEHPAGLNFLVPQGEDGKPGQPQLYVLYSSEEPYIQDDPNGYEPQRLARRDRSLIQPLYYHYDPQGHYTLSNGYRLELCYVEELAPLDPVDLVDVEWRIALPSNTDRQRVISVEPFGLDFTEEEQEGERVAVFRFPQLTQGDRHVFGWRAVIETYGIKYQLLPKHVKTDEVFSEEFKNRYLVDNENLAMETDVVRMAAKEAVGNETNPLRQILSIRDYVYDRLSYRITSHIDNPDVVLERGTGSCGEYVGVLLALCRLNGIPCRTVGRYKCPQPADRFHVPLYPDYNHVWLEFYLPGIGWLPMESNPDDVDDGPHPLRFFMGLAWYHAEIGRGLSFERVFAQGVNIKQLPGDVSIGNLAVNHIRFRILEPIAP